MSESVLQIRIRRLLEFFDGKPPDSKKHATAIASVCGEDLGCGLLRHYFEAHRASVEVRPEPCTTGKRKGPRLDRWVRVQGAAELAAPDVLFQVEVKMWSAHAIGGKHLSLGATSEEVADYKRQTWQKEWHDVEGIKKAPLAKVLHRMTPPPGLGPVPIEPLACLWTALHPDGGAACLFSRPVPERQRRALDTDFQRVWFFSMSTYLRSLSQRTIRVYMPDTARRIGWLSQLLGAPGR